MDFYGAGTSFVFELACVNIMKLFQHEVIIGGV